MPHDIAQLETNTRHTLVTSTVYKHINERQDINSEQLIHAQTES